MLTLSDPYILFAGVSVRSVVARGVVVWCHSQKASWKDVGPIHPSLGDAVLAVSKGGEISRRKAIACSMYRDQRGKIHTVEDGHAARLDNR